MALWATPTLGAQMAPGRALVPLPAAADSMAAATRLFGAGAVALTLAVLAAALSARLATRDVGRGAAAQQREAQV